MGDFFTVNSEVSVTEPPPKGHRLSSVTVMELLSKRLLSIDLPREEGDMINMKQFSSLVKNKLSGGLDLSRLTVGRFMGDGDHDKPLHFFLLDSSPCFAYTSVPQSTVEAGELIYVKGIKGKLCPIRVPLSTSISDVKKLMQDKVHIPPDKQRLIFQSKQLEDHRCLSDYNVDKDSVLFLVLRLAGGGDLCSGVQFTDVTCGKGIQRLEWSNNAPDWWRASPGLCIEGKCTNRRCTAYGNMVIMNRDYTDFDLINDAYLCKCPICHEGVVPVTCAFNNCEWKMISRKVELGKRPQMFKTDWKSVGNWYERFSPEKSGEASFLDLKILALPGAL